MGGSALVMVILVLVSALSFVTGERERNKLKDEIARSKKIQVSLENDMASIKRQPADVDDKVKDLQDKLKEESAERKRLEEALMSAEERRQEALGKMVDIDKETLRAELERRLKKGEEEKKALEEDLRNNRLALDNIEARLRADDQVFKNDRLARKLKEARDTLARAQAAGSLRADTVKELETKIKEAESMLTAAKEGRLSAERLALRSGIKELEGLSKDAAVLDEIVKKEREKAEISLDQLQRDIQQKSREDFRERVAGIENRLAALDADKKVLSDRFADAMTAILGMEETAQRIEAELKMGTGEGAAGVSDTASKFEADIEALKRNRDSVRSSVEKVKSALEEMIGAETRLMAFDTAQVSTAVNRMLPNQAQKISGAPLSEEAIGVKGAQATAEVAIEARGGLVDLNKRLVALNRIIDESFKAADDGKLKVPGLAERLKEICNGDYRETPRRDQPHDNKSVEVYVVKKGDSLWNIASKVYGNPYLWPAIFKNNTPPIDDPDHIKPDTAINVQKSLTPKEMQDSIDAARNRKASKGSAETNN